MSDDKYKDESDEEEFDEENAEDFIEDDLFDEDYDESDEEDRSHLYRRKKGFSWEENEKRRPENLGLSLEEELDIAEDGEKEDNDKSDDEDLEDEIVD